MSEKVNKELGKIFDLNKAVQDGIKEVTKPDFLKQIMKYADQIDKLVNSPAVQMILDNPLVKNLINQQMGKLMQIPQQRAQAQQQQALGGNLIQPRSKTHYELFRYFNSLEEKAISGVLKKLAT